MKVILKLNRLFNNPTTISEQFKEYKRTISDIVLPMIVKIVEVRYLVLSLINFVYIAACGGVAAG